MKKYTQADFDNFEVDAHLETLNGVTKAELQFMLKWVIERFYYCAEED